MKTKGTSGKRRASVVAHPCVLLAVDPGAKAGWAIFASGKLLESGTAKGFSLSDTTMAVDRARELALEQGLPLVVVGEDWTAGGWPSLERFGRLCASWGPWESVALDRGAAVLRVYTQTWRGAMLHTRQRPTKGWKKLAREIVSAMFRLDVPDDTAEAILLGKFAAHSPELRAVLEEAA